MAAPPVTPSDFEALRIQPGDRACDYFSKLAALSNTVADMASWAMNTDGTPSDDLIEWIGVTASSGLQAPSNVTATSNSQDDITVTWSSVEGATGYRVFRGLTSDTADMEQVSGDLTGLSFVNDSSVDLDVIYYYAVKAFNATLTSAFSGTASGKRVSSTDPGDSVTHDTSETGLTSVTVPSGKNRMEIELWGGGGSGGSGGSLPPWSIPALGGGVVWWPGGGGASGSYLHYTGIVVTEGEEFLLQPGGSDAETRLVRGVDGSYAYATKGGAGGSGNFSIGDTSGSPGSPAASPGACSWSGASNAGSTVGNAGSGAVGGGSLDVDYGRGAGGNGGSGNGVSGSPGVGGRIRIVFTTV